MKTRLEQKVQPWSDFPNGFAHSDFSCLLGLVGSATLSAQTTAQAPTQMTSATPEAAATAVLEALKQMTRPGYRQCLVRMPSQFFSSGDPILDRHAS
jgi:hypothetical protein